MYSIYLSLHIYRLVQDKKVLKVGNCIATDAARIFQGHKLRLENTLNLASLAKDCKVVPSAKVTLERLCRLVLNKKLQKDPVVRHGTPWSRNLDTAKLQYAACDAQSSLRIYKALVTACVIKPRLTLETVETGQSVELLLGEVLVAEGTIKTIGRTLNPAKWRTVNVTKTRAIVDLKRVIVPGVVLPKSISGGLADLGSAAKEPSHDIVWPIKQMRQINTGPHIRRQATSITCLLCNVTMSEVELRFCSERKSWDCTRAIHTSCAR